VLIGAGGTGPAHPASAGPKIQNIKIINPKPNIDSTLVANRVVLCNEYSFYLYSPPSKSLTNLEKRRRVC